MPLPTGSLADPNVAAHRLDARAHPVTKTVAASGAALTIDGALGSIWDVTLTAACTFTFANFPTSADAEPIQIVLRQDATHGRVVTWPANIKWAGGTPTFTTAAATSVDRVTLRPDIVGGAGKYLAEASLAYA